ncbi:hypothetical protein P4S64_04175 [Vibrio sp. M60_M31a]
MSANDKQLNSDTSLLDKAQTLLTEITQAEYDKDTVRHFVLHHTSRATSFSNAVNFILTSKSIDGAKYLMDLVCKNFNKVSRLVSAIEDDGAVTLNDDVWGIQ